MDQAKVDVVDFVQVLSSRAAAHPDAPALRFLGDGQRETRRLSYAELHREATRIATALTEHAAPGDRALLLYPSGVEYVTAFLGCLYAGVVAVPAYPPESLQPKHIGRLLSILEDAEPRLILTERSFEPALRSLAGGLPQAAGCPVLASDAISSEAPARFTPPPIDPDAPAFLQYTSGSTSSPRGVCVSHRNILANEAVIQAAFALTPADVVVSWLPLFHDMGLIGSLLQPLYVGASLVLMSPQAFISRPLRWLEAIAQFGGTVSGGPNFGYRLVAEQLQKLADTGAAAPALDLRRWRLAFCGAEPVRADTLARFAEGTVALGFDAASLYPCYGLAEATLFVSGGAPRSGVTVSQFSRAALSRGQAALAEAGATADSASLVALGAPQAWHRVRIVDPATGAALGQGRVGEVQVSGPSVTRGYHRNEAATAAALCLEAGETWLRTGDLGFEREGQLFISGRSKNLIIVRGQNLYAEDIEQHVEACVEVVRRGRVAAFPIEIDGSEHIALMAELAKPFEKLTQPEAVCRVIAESVAEAFHEPPLVVLVKAGTLPLTSSGKLQRSLARRAWEGGEVSALGVFREGGSAGAGSVSLAEPAMAPVLSPLEARLAGLWSAVLGGQPPGPDESFFARGGSSLDAVALVTRVEQELGVVLPLGQLFESPTLRALARCIELAPRANQAPETRNTARAGSSPLSAAERRIYLATQLDVASGAYNIAAGVSFDGQLDIDCLARALDALVARHEPLRTVYPSALGRPERRILAAAPLPLPVVDLLALPEPERLRSLAELEAREASLPFDVARGPLLRASLWRIAPSQHRLAFTVHHLIADGRSLDILLEELVALYRAGGQTSSAGLSPLVLQYADVAASEHAGVPAWRERALDYFRGRLGAEHPPLELPTDHARPAAPSGASGHLGFALGRAELTALGAVARARSVTPFMLVLAAFDLFLHRYAGRPRQVRVGVPVLNRSGAEQQRLVGCFINTVVLATDFEGLTTFGQLLSRVKQAAVEALEHQRLPFDELATALAPERTLAFSPLFQVMFSWRPEVEHETIELGGLRLTREAPSDQLSKFDLTLHATELPSGIDFRFVYRADLFEAATVAGFRDAFLELLREVVAAPETPLDQLDVGPRAGRERALRDWNAPAAPLREPSLQGWMGEAARRWPERRAAQGPDGCITYAQLEQRSARLGLGLRERGVRPGDRVGLRLERSTDFVVALLAVLRCGAAYVPLDPKLPAARLAELVSDSAVSGVIEHAATAASFDIPVAWRLRLDQLALDVGPSELAALAPCPELPAYVLYTSGSTGRPKGVVVTQRGAVSYTQALLDRLAIPEAEDGWALVSTLAADLGNTVLFGALCSGRCLHLLSEDCVFDPDAFAAYMREHAISVLKIVPSHLSGLLDANQPTHVLPRHTLVLGGEATSWGLVERIESLRGPRIVNHYGPTETTVGVLTFELARGVDRPLSRTLPLGRPLANSQVYVLTPELWPAPVGVPGEVFIGGDGVAQGYLARPGLTAERFVPDPFGAAGARLYRTGDRARYLADGNVEFLGRWDEQIKLRGFRIELGEIRAQLRAVPGVNDALVVVQSEGNRRERLVAYVIAEGANARVEVLEQALGICLPEYMRPSDYVFLERFPLTPNGKLDRQALPRVAPRTDAELVAPRTEAEAALAQVWQELLGLERVSVRDNFFKLGGDSITTLQVVARARRLGLELSPKQLFEHQTIEAAAAVARPCEPAHASNDGAGADARGGAPGACAASRSRARRSDLDGPPVLADFPLSGLSEEEWQSLSVPHEQIEDIFPLSPMQQGMLIHTLLEPGSGIYLMQDHYRVDSALDAEHFVAAWRLVIERHAALRASFVWQREENMLQIIHRASADVAVQFFDLSDLTPEAQEREIERFFAEELRQGYDLGQPGLFRIRLFRLGAEKYHFVQSRHHIVLDAWCRSLLLVDFFQIYRERTAGVAASLVEAPVYRDFIAWLGQRDGAALRAFWRQNLSGFEAANPLSVDRPIPRGGRGSAVVDAVTFLTPAQTLTFNGSARQLGLTPNTLAQAAWALVLSQYASQRDVVFGVTVAGRPAELEGIQDTVGLFINTLPLRVAVPAAGASSRVSAWLEELHARNVALRQYEQLSLVEIQAQSAILRGEQLFHSLFVFENAPLDRSLERWGRDLNITFGSHRTHTNYPLTVVVIPGERTKLVFSYDERRFEARDVARMLEHYRQVVLWLSEHPEAKVSEAPRVSEAEVEQQEVWNRTEREYPLGAGYAALFEEQVEQHAERVAVQSGRERLTYRALDERAEAVGWGLREAGVSADAVVGVFAERGVGFVSSVIGVFKAGGAYVPLDPKHPSQRMQEVLELSGARVVVTTAASEKALRAALGSMASNGASDASNGASNGSGRKAPRVLVLEQLEAEQRQRGPVRGRLPKARVRGEQLAYVIYTSGSTGKPKGAMVTVAGMLNNQLSKLPFLGLGAEDVVAQTASQSFDISVWQNLAALLCGGRVEVIADEVAQDAEQLLGWVRERGVTVLESVPSLIGGMLSLGEGGEAPSLGGLRVLMPTGEALLPELARQWLKRYPAVPLVNAYGPAECADDVSLWRIEEPPAAEVLAVPIGRATDNNRLYVLDAELERVAIGVVGEVCVAGVGVGRGYLGDASKTAEVFVPHPYGAAGERLYRTGDLARQRWDGALEYVGRRDQQVKVRGCRIELGEIEARLVAEPGVREAAVLALGSVGGLKRLVGYVALARSQAAPERDDERVAIALLKERLAQQLPEYMVPAQWVVLAELPKSDNGKVDRKALPAPDAADTQRAYAAPENDAERTLADIWQQLLRVERVGREDNFFELGGDSIVALQLVSRAKRLGLDLSPRDVFEQPALSGLARVALGRRADGAAANGERKHAAGSANGAPTQRGGSGAGQAWPLLPSQHWFFEQALAEPNHFNQSVLLELPAALELGRLERALQALVTQHPALTLRFQRTAAGWVQSPDADSAPRLESLDLSFEIDPLSALEREAQQIQRSLDIERGPVFRAVHVKLGDEDAERLLLVAHHLVVDAVSWRVLIEDLEAAHADVGALARRSSASADLGAYARALAVLGEADEASAERDFYTAQLEGGEDLPGADADVVDVSGDARTLTARLTPEESRQLVQLAPRAYRTQTLDLLLTALAETFCAWSGQESLLVQLGTHGRQALGELDAGHVVGWFAGTYPVRLRPHLGDRPASIKAIKEQLRAVPREGLGYAGLRFASHAGPALRELAQRAPARVHFNHFGNLPSVSPQGLFRWSHAAHGDERAAANRRDAWFDVGTRLTGDTLEVSLRYGVLRHTEPEARGLLEAFMGALRELIGHTLLPEAGGVTPSDFPLIRLTQAELDELEVPPRNIEDIYPLSPMQQGMLVHTLLEPGSGIYVMQEHFRFDSVMDVDAFLAAWRAVAARHAPLRTSFAWQAEGQMMQIVQRRLPPPVEYLDWAERSSEQQERDLEELVTREQQSGFDLARAPLARFRLIRFSPQCFYFIKSYHHILIDGWCSSLLLVEFFERYRALTENSRLELRNAPAYRDFIAWLGKKDPQASLRYWQNELRGFTTVTPIPTLAPLGADAGVSRVAEEVLYLSAEDTERLVRAAQQCRITPNTFAQGAWALLLSQYAGQREVLFGVTVAGRPAELEGIQDTVGLFINTIPLRTTLPEPGRGTSVAEWLGALLTQNVAMRQHEHVPLVEIQALSELPRGQRLFDSLFVFENAPLDASLMQRKYEFRADLNSHRTHTNYPLTAVVIPGKRAKLIISYDERTSAPRDVERMLQHYRDLLTWLAEHPQGPLSEAPRVSEAEVAQQEVWNRTEREYALGAGYAALFEEQVERHAERVAVQSGRERLTYRALDERAEAVGWGLREAGVSADAVVGVFAERGVGFVSSVIGVFKAGGAYVPLDPKHPSQRMQEVLELSGARVVVTTAASEKALRAALGSMASNGASDASNGASNGSGRKAPRVLVLEQLEAEQRQRGQQRGRLPKASVREDQLAYVIYTSGSTGKPKGAMVTVAGMLNNQLSKLPFLGLGAEDVVAQTASQSFDISVWQNLAALLCGGRVEVIADEVAQDAEQLLGWVRERGVTVLESVPSLIGGMLSLGEGGEAPSLGGLRVLMPTGEALLPELARQWLKRYPAVPLVNAYGPAECADDVSLWRIEEPPAAEVLAVPIGRATDNNRLYVLDAELERVAIGVVGEVCVAGVGVGRGYLGDASKTAEVFVPNPYGAAGERLYRTGDLARQRWDGALEYVGRRDQQVKVRGYRIELGEIEARLVAEPGVREAAVLALGNAQGGGKRLVGYVALEAGQAASAPADERAVLAELKERLAQQLPEYMVPAQWVVLAELPKSDNGKVDRKALPAPDAADTQRAYAAPENDAERMLADIWQQLLRVERVGREDNFFELGGDSIVALQLVSRAKRLGLELSPRDVFGHAELSALAAVARPFGAAAGASATLVAPQAAAAAQAVEAPRSEGPLVSLSDAELDALGIPRDNIEDIYPLSPMQQGMLVHTLLEPGSGMYLMQEIYHFDRPVDPEAFVAAWSAVIARHATLRASFNWQLEGKMLQIVQREIPSPVHYLDLGHLGAEEQRQAIRQIVQDELSHGFDLSQAPLLALRLIRCHDQSFYFIESYHHILIDGWCSSLILVEFFARYRALLEGKPLELEPAPRYRDFIAWLGRQDRQAQQHYWREVLQGFTERTPLGIARPLLAGAGVSRVHEEISFLTRAETERLVRAAQRARVTPNTLAQAAWALLLSQYSGQREVLFGVTVAGRPTELPAAEDTVGLFINTIPLRTTLPDAASGERVASWLERLLAQNLEMRQHEHVPLVEIQGLGELPRGQRLFDSLLVFENAPLDASLTQRKFDLQAELTSQRTHTNYPLTVVVTPGPEVELRFSYDQRVFELRDIQRMLAHYRQVVLWLSEHPEAEVQQAPRLNEAEVDAQDAWNRTEREYPLEAGYAALFEKQVQRHGERLAVQCGAERVTYQHLDERAEAVGWGLRRAGVGADDVVGVFSERGVGFVASVIGTFKAGGAYVPLDPKHPPARMLEVLSLSGARVVLTTAASETALRAALEESWPTRVSNASAAARPEVLVLEELEAVSWGARRTRLPKANVRGEQLAYVIYTSGSTGKPKGAMVTVAGMLNNQLSKLPFLGLGAEDVVAQTASQSFDISVWQNLAALLCGGRVEVIADEVAQDAEQLLGWVRERGVTVLESVPSLIGGMLSLGEGGEAPNLGGLRVLMPTGEALLPELARQWLKRYPAVPLVNAYGPAECADDVSLWRIEEPPAAEVLAVPIGRATDNNRLYVLDAELERVAIGVVGEVCVAGVGVGRGYLGDASKTAEVFVPHPYGEPGERLYRTGDLARQRWDGALEYVGRRDQQVKVRGYRIELGEIEARLVELPQVEAAVVLARGDTGRGRRLVAYVVLRGTSAEREQVVTLKAALARQLPEYMLPSQWVLLDELPRSRNGKIDRLALPEPGGPDEQRAFVAPESDVERALAGIWEQLLRVNRVGLEDDFFELGGDSIVALQLMSRAKRAGLALQPRAVFEHPVLGALAQVTTRAEAADGSALHPERDRGSQHSPPSGEVPLLPIQHWFFEQPFANKHHWNQSVLLSVPPAVDVDRLERSLVAVIAHHTGLGLRFRQTDAGWRQWYGPAEAARLDSIDLSAEADPVAALEREANRVQRSLDLEHGPLSRYVLFRWQDQRRVLVVMHHLISDSVTLRILFEDWHEAYATLGRGEEVRLAAVPTSYQRWSRLLQEHAASAAIANELPYWRNVLGGERTRLPARDPNGDNRVRSTRTLSVSLREAETSALLSRAPRLFGTQVNDLLLCALALTLCRWSRQRSVLVEVEGHGREPLFDGVDLSRTVGWFTAPQMIRLEPVPGDLPASIRAIRAQLRRAPNHGFGYGLTRYLTPAGKQLEDLPFPQVFFNYLGQFDQLFVDDAWLSPASEPRGDERCPDSTEDAWFGSGGVVHAGRLRIDFRYSQAIHDEATARQLIEQLAEQLREIVQLCTRSSASAVTELPAGAE